MTLVLNACTYAWERGGVPVLRDFDFVLPEGLTVLLGPRGAGKSTLMQLAASEIVPQSGTVAVDGEPAGTRAYRRAVGWLPDGVTPMTGLRAREFVAYVGWLKGMGRAEAWRAAADALERVRLTEHAGRPTGRLAPDGLALLGLATTLVHGARVLLLDEPTTGLHLQHREIFQDVLTDLVADFEVRVLLATSDPGALPGLAARKPADAAGTVAVLDTDQDESAVLYAGDPTGFLAHAPDGTPHREAPAAALAAVLGEQRADTP